jgi:hypothetical protein
VAGQNHEYGSDDFEKHDAAKELFTVPFRPVYKLRSIFYLQFMIVVMPISDIPSAVRSSDCFEIICI